MTSGILPPDPPLPWERQDSETQKAYDAFAMYRDWPYREGGRPDVLMRTLRGVASDLGKSRALIERWSSRHHWVDRAASWDAEVDRRRGEAFLRETAKMSERQARNAERIQWTLLAPIEALARKIEKDPTILDRLDPKVLLEIAVVATNRFVNAAKLERLARGEATDAPATPAASLDPSTGRKRGDAWEADEVRAVYRKLEEAGVLDRIESEGR